MLWPPEPVASAGNNDSCVLRIDDGRFRELITGDIEAPAERALLRLDRPALRAELLQVPHHGSKTSSTAPFFTGGAAADGASPGGALQSLASAG